MKYFEWVFFILLVALAGQCANALRCYNCYVDSVVSFDLLQPKGPIWEKCTGNEEDQDFEYCGLNNDVCIELMIYGDDSSKYQIIRSCAYGPEVCSKEFWEIDPEIHIGNCKTCSEDDCNDSLS